MECMDFTENDFVSARKILAASIDGKCFHPPEDVSPETIKRLCSYGWFDDQLGLPILSLCDEENLAELEKRICDQRAAYQKQKVADLKQNRADKMKRFGRDVVMLTLGSAINAVFENFADIIGFCKSSSARSWSGLKSFICDTPFASLYTNLDSNNSCTTNVATLTIRMQT